VAYILTWPDPIASKNKHQPPNAKAQVSTSELLSTSVDSSVIPLKVSPSKIGGVALHRAAIQGYPVGHGHRPL
jgi:hypothetical protein